MKNDSTRGGRKISIPPTVLFSTIAKIDDIAHAVSTDAKFAGDVIYAIGLTKKELGGSEYFAMLGDAHGNNVPKVDAEKASALYHALADVIKADIPSSVITPSLGGLAVAFAKSAMGGRLGFDIDLGKIPAEAGLSDIEILFSESNSRFVLTCKPEKADALEKALAGFDFAKIGTVTENPVLSLNSASGTVSIALDELVDNYKKTLAGV